MQNQIRMEQDHDKLQNISDVQVMADDSLLPEQDDLLIKAQLPNRPNLLETTIVEQSQPCQKYKEPKKKEDEDKYKGETQEERFKRKSQMYYDALDSITMESLVFKIDHTQQKHTYGDATSLFTVSDVTNKAL